MLAAQLRGSKSDSLPDRQGDLSFFSRVRLRTKSHEFIYCRRLLRRFVYMLGSICDTLGPLDRCHRWLWSQSRFQTDASRIGNLGRWMTYRELAIHTSRHRGPGSGS